MLMDTLHLPRKPPSWLKDLNPDVLILIAWFCRSNLCSVSGTEERCNGHCTCGHRVCVQRFSVEGAKPGSIPQRADWTGFGQAGDVRGGGPAPAAHLTGLCSGGFRRWVAVMETSLQGYSEGLCLLCSCSNYSNCLSNTVLFLSQVLRSAALLLPTSPGGRQPTWTRTAGQRYTHTRYLCGCTR